MRLELLGRTYEVTPPAGELEGFDELWGRSAVDGSGVGEATTLVVPVSEDEGPTATTGWLTDRALADAAGKLLLLHACGLALDDGRTAALVAPSGAGKTTAALTLGRRFGYVSDEVVALGAGLEVVPFPRPLCVLGPSSPAKVPVGPDTLELLTCPDRPVLHRVVVLDRVAERGDVPAAEPLSLVDALLAVIPQTSYLRDHERPLATLAATLSTTAPVRLRYREVADTADLLDELLRSTPTTPLPWEPEPLDAVEPGSVRWAVRDGRVRRRPVADAIRVGDDIVVLAELTPVALRGIGPTVWAAAADEPTIAELTAAVERAHGHHPDSAAIVATTVAELVAAGVLGCHPPEPLDRHRVRPAARTSVPPPRPRPGSGTTGPEPVDPAEIEVPLGVRVQLAHAVLQHLAHGAGLDLLHLKGPAIHPALRADRPRGTDADVLVRAGDEAVLLAELGRHGWSLHISAEAGSPFAHATTMTHPSFGYADVHRTFPGVTIDRDESFDLWWATAEAVDIAGIACAVPDLDHQRLLLTLNAARGGPHAGDDLELAWTSATDTERLRTRELARRFGAEVALAAAIGELDLHRDARDHDLWRVTSEGGSRTGEWRARVRAEPALGRRIRVALRAPRVNLESLAVQLGHPPNRAEVSREYLRRVRRGLDEIFASTRRRLGRSG